MTSRQLLEIDTVPGILQLPNAAERAPAVLLLHGLNSRKERLADTIGRSLLARGVASLAIDLPAHGGRDEGSEAISLQNPLALVRAWRRAIREADHGLEFLASHPDIDVERIAIAGYSLGAYLALFVAAENPDVRAVALVAGGDLPQGIPMEKLVRSAADPRKAVRELNGRPLLMVNGRNDTTILPAQATALFEYASEPKELVWYAGGHWPPERVTRDVAEWLARV